MSTIKVHSGADNSQVPEVEKGLLWDRGGRVMKGTKVLVTLPKDFDLELSKWIAELKFRGIRYAKAELLVKLAMIGFNQEIKK